MSDQPYQSDEEVREEIAQLHRHVDQLRDRCQMLEERLVTIECAEHASASDTVSSSYYRQPVGTGESRVSVGHIVRGIILIIVGLPLLAFGGFGIILIVIGIVLLVTSRRDAPAGLSSGYQSPSGGYAVGSPLAQAQQRQQTSQPGVLDASDEMVSSHQADVLAGAVASPPLSTTQASDPFIVTSAPVASDASSDSVYSEPVTESLPADTLPDDVGYETKDQEKDLSGEHETQDFVRHRVREPITIDTVLGWFGKVGIVSLVLGVALLIQSDAGRDAGNALQLAKLALGILTGISLIIGGHRISASDTSQDTTDDQENTPRTPSVSLRNWGKMLVGGGFALIYFAVYASHHFAMYHAILNSHIVVNIILLAFVSRGTLSYARRTNNPTIATFALLLGYMTSMLGGNDAPSQLIVRYLALLSAGILTVVIAKRWLFLGVGALLITYGVFAWHHFVVGQLAWGQSLALLGIYFCLFGAHVVITHRRDGPTRHTITLTLLNTLCFFGLAFPIIGAHAAGYRGVFVALLAGVYGLMTMLIYTKKTTLVHGVHLYLSLMFAVVFVLVQIDKQLVSLVWSMLLIVLTVLGYRSIDVDETSNTTGAKRYRIASYVLGSIIVIKAATIDMLWLDNFSGALWQHPLTWLIIATIGLVETSALIHRRQARRVEDDCPDAKRTFDQEIIAGGAVMSSIWTRVLLLIAIALALWVGDGIDSGRGALWIMIVLVGLLHVGAMAGYRIYAYQGGALTLLVGLMTLLLTFEHGRWSGYGDVSLVVVWLIVVALLYLLGALWRSQPSLTIGDRPYARPLTSGQVMRSVLAYSGLGLFVCGWMAIYGQYSYATTLVFSLLSVGLLWVTSRFGGVWFVQSMIVLGVVLLKSFLRDLFQAVSLQAGGAGYLLLAVIPMMALIAIAYRSYMLASAPSDTDDADTSSTPRYDIGPRCVMMVLILAAVHTIGVVGHYYRGTDGVSLMTLGWLIIAGVSVGLSTTATTLPSTYKDVLRLGGFAVLGVSVLGALLRASVRHPSMVDYLAMVLPIAAIYGVAAWAGRSETSIMRFCPNSSLRKTATWIASSVLFVALSFQTHDVGTTLAWVVLAFVFVVGGIAAKNSQLRLQGIIIFVLTILKVFVFDTRNLDMMGRIFSFIILGVLLLIVSYLYTRYKFHIHHALLGDDEENEEAENNTREKNKMSDTRV